MSSKYTEAFDSLKSNDETKRERTERILAAQSAATQEKTARTDTLSAAKTRRRFFAGKRGVALLTTIAVFVASIAVSVPLGISIYNKNGLLNAMAQLKNTFVDMDGIAAFGVWNAPDSSSKSRGISNVSYVKSSSPSAADDFVTTGETGAADIPAEKNDVSDGDWSDDERYDWESDYDWDPTKANVLIAINEDGTIKEVVYERTNGRGIVRQDVLGNAAMVYVSEGFTYVMYVNDSEWDFWQSINFAQEMVTPNGFHCHHESMQTVVIHNATGKVFALKDLIPQVNELSGAMNHTMQVHPFNDDFLSVQPMYGNRIPQWYTVIYDEQTEKIRYELMLPPDSDALKSYNYLYYVRAARRDKYGQQYLLEGYNNYEIPRITEGIVNLPSYTRYGNSLVFSTQNGMMLGTDKRMYVFDEGKIKVFGENFELQAIEPDIEVAFEGMANDFFDYGRSGNEGIAYKLSGGYLYSMFGEVWKVDDDGTLHSRERLTGSFPRFADDGYLIGGEIIAYVDTMLTEDGKASINGRMVKIDFECTDDTPQTIATHIINAPELIVSHHRIVILQCERPYSMHRGSTKYFLLTVRNGSPYVDYFGYGYDGGINGLTRPITEPLIL